ncbi:IGF-like family receptor 1 [Chelmon rostratus]|uniref:IGF-like family receptor 1 n=1 Tax=Chelmon rostratus TaxID=109905 RepID=UPI001BECAB51|nr:IGF-like family receptor 1 [Chelmon rostratus]
MGHSNNCPDLTTRWDRRKQQCVSCNFAPGREITPNCGFDDYGGRHEPPTTPCTGNTFNDGSRAYCQPCTTCPPGYDTVGRCSLTADTQCGESRRRTTEAPHQETTKPQTFFSRASTIQTESSLAPKAAATPDVLWAVPLAICISIALVVLSVCAIYIKRKRGQNMVLSFDRRSSYINAGFSSLSSPPGNNDLEDILSPIVLAAPLQTVLNNLDVLEELVILLDPESHGVKNTKHLASHCSFPSTWITYTYSMKDSKSPLKAVLEGVTSRHPEWTVGHLTKMLKLMERNDAIAVLAKLRLNDMDV